MFSTSRIVNKDTFCGLYLAVFLSDDLCLCRISELLLEARCLWTGCELLIKVFVIAMHVMFVLLLFYYFLQSRPANGI